MITDERDAAEAFIEELAGRAMPGGAVDAEAAQARGEAAREDAAHAREALRAGGLDPQSLDRLAAERGDARRARVEDARRRAIDASADVGRRLADLTPILPELPDSMNVILDRVTFIRSFADAGVVVDSNIGSLDSWARYRLSASADSISETGLGRLSFFVLWHNPRTEAVVVNVGPRVVVNAHLSVDAEWNGTAAWFIGGSEARATVRARTTVWAMWDNSVHAIVHDRILASAGATGGFFGGDDSASIAFNEFLPGAGFFVPAQASILIEVEILTEHVTTNGSISLDAESGAFRVEVPHLILTLTG